MDLLLPLKPRLLATIGNQPAQVLAPTTFDQTLETCQSTLQNLAPLAPSQLNGHMLPDQTVLPLVKTFAEVSPVQENIICQININQDLSNVPILEPTADRSSAYYKNTTSADQIQMEQKPIMPQALIQTNRNLELPLLENLAIAHNMQKEYNSNVQENIYPNRADLAQFIISHSSEDKQTILAPLLESEELKSVQNLISSTNIHTQSQERQHTKETEVSVLTSENEKCLSENESITIKPDEKLLNKEEVECFDNGGSIENTAENCNQLTIEDGA